MSLLERLKQPPNRDKILESLAYAPFRNNLMYYIPDVTEHLPGLKKGELMGNWHETVNPITLNRDMIRGLLFANCESYEHMKENIYQEIREMGGKYERRYPRDYKNQKEKRHESFDPEPIIRTLNLVEKAYLGQTRRSGEPEFAHALRVVKRGLDFISLNMDLYNAGYDIQHIFDPDQAQYLLLMCALHDFFEDKRKVNGQDLPMGKLDLELVSKRGSHVKHRLTIKRYGNPYLDENPQNLIQEDSATLEGDTDHMGFLQTGLDALRSDGDDPAEQFSHLLEYAQKKTEEYGFPLSQRLILWYNLPFLTKVFDRQDNMATYLLGNKRVKWNWNQVLTKIDLNTDMKRFHPPRRYEVIEKSRETLDYLLRSEQIMGMTMSHKPLYYLQYVKSLKEYAPSIVVNLMNNGFYFEKWHKDLKPGATLKPEAFFRYHVLRLRPSRIATYYLLGLGVNDIFENSGIAGELPQVI